MENQDLKEKVLTNLRSVAQSCKGGVPLDRLNRDYREILGSNIPYRELGYNSLEAFIRSIPTVISVRRNHDGQLMAEGVADATTAHIVSLVSKQRSDTKKRGFRKPPSSLGIRRTSRYTIPRDSYSNYSSSASHYPARSSKPRQVSPKHVSPRQVPAKPLLPNPVAAKPPSTSYNSKPSFKSNDQVPSRKYEVAPRFKRLQNQNINPSPPPVEERVVSPVPIVQSPVRTAPRLSNSENWEVIPPPMIPPPQPTSRSLPSRPRHIENSRYAQLNSLESTKSAKEYVDVYSNMNNIKPVYTTVQFGQKAKNKGYVSTLCLGEKKYQSYPELKSTKEAAEEVVAKKATEDIKKMMQEQMDSLPETPYGTTEEIKQLLIRIEEIVCEKPSGMFENGIVQEYESKFNEILPACWPELLKQSAYVEIDAISLANGRVPKGANFIVRPTKELSSGNRTPSSTSSKTEFVHEEDLDTGTLKKTLVDISYPKVPDIVLPDGNIWEVYVTNIINDFSVRLYDYSDAFLALSIEMSTFYNTRSLPVAEVMEGKVYVCCVDEKPDLWWHRVLVEEVKEDEMICYLVDEGDFLYVKKENLQEICPSFLELPFQAIHVSLDGLEEYENCIKHELLQECILGKMLIAEVKRMQEFPEFFNGVPGIHRTVYSVILYDTSGEDLNLNEWLKKSVEESLVCKLPKLQTSSCAYLSHVTSNGRVFLRFTNPQQCWIEQELEKLYPVFEEAASSTFEILPVDTVCVAKYESTTWHRAIVSENQLASSDPDMVEVFFVDYGHCGIVERSEICQLEPMNGLLASIPHQAVCCELVNALPSPTSQWTEAASKKLLDLAPFDQELIIIVTNEEDEQNLAKVNLFKRNQENDIVSINTTLYHNPSLFSHPTSSVSAKLPMKLPLQPGKSLLKNNLSSTIPDVAVPAEQMAKRMVESKSSEELKLKWLDTPDDIKSPGAFDVQSPVYLDMAPVPDIKEYFDVFVTMAANPYNFVVQPNDQRGALQKLMTEMQNFYSSEENLLPTDITMLRKNEFYAALHSDGTWYRVRIAEIMTTNPVMVAAHYIDYGDFTQLNIGNLQPLYLNFKILPCLAIQASLSGIRPYESDWDPVHCVEFQQIVTEKTFVSMIQKKTLQTKGDIPTQTLELTLIDTSTEDDIYINDLLVDRRMAKPL